MRKIYALLVLVLLSWPTITAAQPATIPRTGRSPHDSRRTYRIIRDYLANPANGLYTFVSTDPARHTLVARRSGIDARHWSEWAYCKLGPEAMLDTLENGTVTLTVSVEPLGSSSSEMTVTAGFRATYALGKRRTVTQCISTGILEKRLLRAAGALSYGA